MNITKLYLVSACCSVLMVFGGCATTATVSPAAGNAEPYGHYKLVAVNGLTLPAIISHHGAELRVQSGTFQIKDDGTCSSATVFGPPSGNDITRMTDASCAMKGTAFVMQWEGAGTTVGRVIGESFTMDNHGMIFDYVMSVRY